jgi:glycosyltransferase involved in cell wall biosynthesis
MKVLYIGHYKEFGGWGQAATDYILALDKVGVDVVCRNVTLTQDKPDVHPRILELEKKETTGSTVCIQHVLPHHIEATDGFEKNIAFFAGESTSIKHLPWFDCLQLVDQVWVPNADLKGFLDEDQLGVDVRVIPHTTDMGRFKQSYNPLPIPSTQNKFKFYYIGDVNARKNLDTIITCFNSEFDKYEDVCLIVKVNKFGIDPEVLTRELDGQFATVKQSMRMYNDVNDYPKEIIIANRMTENQLCSLHATCDCFVAPSRGEAWSIPSFDAMAFGNTPIVSDFGGTKDFVESGNWRTGHKIKGVYRTCKYPDPAFPDLFTGREFWFQPCEKQIREQMRTSFNSWKKDPIAYKSRNQAAGVKRAENYSYDNIGKLMRETLSE